MTDGCFCGRVRYEIRGLPFNATLCHCRDCRRVTGAPAVGWFTCRPDELVFTDGAARCFASSTGVMRGFCAECGTALTYAQAALPDDVPPRDHTWYRHRIAWMSELAGLPTFPDGRADGPAGRP